MTDEEKALLKQLNRLILDLIYIKGVHEGVLKTKVAEWQREVDAASASSTFQAHRREIEEVREAIDGLIENGDIVGAMGKIKGGYVH